MVFLIRPHYKWEDTPYPVFERMHMNAPNETISCSDDTQQITIHLPCRLAERIEKYAGKNENTVTGVIIEALDTFLRNRKSE